MTVKTNSRIKSIWKKWAKDRFRVAFVESDIQMKIFAVFQSWKTKTNSNSYLLQPPSSKIPQFTTSHTHVSSQQQLKRTDQLTRCRNSSKNRRKVRREESQNDGKKMEDQEIENLRNIPNGWCYHSNFLSFPVLENSTPLQLPKNWNQNQNNQYLINPKLQQPNQLIKIAL